LKARRSSASARSCSFVSNPSSNGPLVSPDCMECLRTAELILAPLTVAHAEAMFPVLSEPALYRYLDYGPPPSVEHVRGVYAKLEKRAPPDGSETWLNWIVCLRSSRVPIGFVQATLVSQSTSWVAYLLSGAHWGRGYAHAAMGAMLLHLTERYGATEFLATVEDANARSISLLERLAFERATVEEVAPHELSSTELLFKRRGAPRANAP